MDFGSNTTFKDSLEGIFFRRDGLMFFHTGKQNDKVHSWTLTTAWDISTATFTSTFDTSGVDATMTFVSVHPDGNKLYFGGHSSAKIHQASM